MKSSVRKRSPRVRPGIPLWAVPWASLVLLPAVTTAFQDDEDAPPPAARQAQNASQEVIIKREAIKLTDARLYRASLQLQAARSLVLTAPVDGIVRTVSAKPQQKLNLQAEAIRLDDARPALVVKRAKALLQAAQIERKVAQARNDADQLALADARVEAAQAELDLAQLDAEQLIVRAPFAGEIDRVYVSEGQFVRAGDRLASLFDGSKLVVEIPVERAAAAPGAVIDLRVEENSARAKVESILPLAPQFDALRELAISPASALVSIDNAAGKFAPGQTVHADLIPLAPVTLVPSIAIGNQSDGQRKIQVLRDNVVRDLTVRIHGKVGTDSVYVSGRFSESDEVIVSSTRPLTDGTPLRALLASAVPPGKGTGARPAGGSPATGGKKPAVGF
jgi:membrane fusion protein, multidrug efflux system